MTYLLALEREAEGQREQFGGVQGLLVVCGCWGEYVCFRF